MDRYMKFQILRSLFLLISLSFAPSLMPMFPLEEEEAHFTHDTSMPDTSMLDSQVINMSDKTGKTLVGYAIETEKVILLETLLLQGADPNAPTHGKMPLMLAVEQNMPEIVDQLLLFGAKDPDVYDLFVAAIKNRSKKIIHSLVRSGFDINSRSADDSFPLVEAVLSQDSDIIEAFLQLGADREMRDGQNRTAFDVVRQLQTPAPRGVAFSIKHLKEASDSIVDDRAMSRISDKEVLDKLQTTEVPYANIDRAKEIAQQLASMPIDEAVDMYSKLDRALQKDVLLFVPLYLHARIKPSVLRRSPVSAPTQQGFGCVLQ